MNISRLSRPLILCALAMLLGSLNGCVVFIDGNHRLVDKLDEHDLAFESLNKLDRAISPKEPLTQAALAPVAIPTATVAWIGDTVLFLTTGAVDAFVVNPVVAVPMAVEDTYNLLWAPRDIDALTKALLFGPVVILTPPTFAIAWLGRSFLVGVNEEDR